MAKRITDKMRLDWLFWNWARADKEMLWSRGAIDAAIRAEEKK